MEGMKMFLIIGALVVIGVIYLLLKRHESRMVLIAAGILMCCIAGKPMASLLLHGLCLVHEVYRLRQAFGCRYR